MWRTSLQRMKSSVSHVRSSADKPVNRTPGSSPVWQRPLNEISSYFRDLEFVTPTRLGFYDAFRGSLRENINKEVPLQCEYANKKEDLALSERVLHECSRVLLDVHPVTFNEV